jgi:hypothetical protein
LTDIIPIQPNICFEFRGLKLRSFSLLKRTIQFRLASVSNIKLTFPIFPGGEIAIARGLSWINIIADAMFVEKLSRKCLSKREGKL